VGIRHAIENHIGVCLSMILGKIFIFGKCKKKKDVEEQTI